LGLGAEEWFQASSLSCTRPEARAFAVARGVEGSEGVAAEGARRVTAAAMKLKAAAEAERTGPVTEGGAGSTAAGIQATLPIPLSTAPEQESLPLLLATARAESKETLQVSLLVKLQASLLEMLQAS